VADHVLDRRAGGSVAHTTAISSRSREQAKMPDRNCA
jgi:hypothetical protein